MKTRLILKPGQKGTKRFAEIYGESLRCVRFHYDEETHKRLKTVELIVEESNWTPTTRYAADTIVPLRI